MRYISALPSKSGQVFPRSLTILGSTGSIGVSTLEVVRLQQEKFIVTALAGARNIVLLAAQAAEFRPAYLGVLEEYGINELRSMLPAGYNPIIVCGYEGYKTLAAFPAANTHDSIVVSAQSGAAGLHGTLAAVQAGKIVALANKESLVLAGDLIRAECAKSGAMILPVDSEHNAIFQCFLGHDPQSVRRLILTASGGPFYGKTRGELEHVDVNAALAHPNWRMGNKITIDSATMMNKGLEVIEACRLYDMDEADVDVIVHRESIVHSLVEFKDGSQLAQLGVPDMCIAISYCLGAGERICSGVAPLDLVRIGSLSFAYPDEDVFPALRLARLVLRRGCGGSVVLNAANEVAVEAFLQKRISFMRITEIVRQTLDAHYEDAHLCKEPATAEDILALDARGREVAWKYISITIH